MLRGALVSVIYAKSLEVSIDELNQSAAVSLMSIDADSIADALTDLHELWANPIEISVAIWLLRQQIGVACIIPILISIGP
jgi:ATP-binding cassette subfamily C (CFTR/MRP) protein 1